MRRHVKSYPCALTLALVVAGCGADSLPPTADAAPPQCIADAECDDGNPCTADRCDANQCHARPLPAETECSRAAPGNGAGRCDGPSQCLAGAPLQTDDGDACTV